MIRQLGGIHRYCFIELVFNLLNAQIRRATCWAILIFMIPYRLEWEFPMPTQGFVNSEHGLEEAQMLAESIGALLQTTGIVGL